MKHALDRSAVQLVLCQSIMEMDDEDMEAAFKEITGMTIEDGHDDEEAGWYADYSLPGLIEDRIGLDKWLDHLRAVCCQRVK